MWNPRACGCRAGRRCSADEQTWATAGLSGGMRLPASPQGPQSLGRLCRGGGAPWPLSWEGGLPASGVGCQHTIDW